MSMKSGLARAAQKRPPSRDREGMVGKKGGTLRPFTASPFRPTQQACPLFFAPPGTGSGAYFVARVSKSGFLR
jgi:hypothetical protein